MQFICGILFRMKFLAVLSVAVACVAADVSHLHKEDYSVPIVKSSFDSSPEGSFQYAYETGNGIYAQAQGTIKNPNAEYPTLAVQGAYKYTSPDGTPVELSYTADEEGYKPVGSHIPVPPPLPELIAKSLAYISAHPPQAETYKPSPSYQPAPSYQG